MPGPETTRAEKVRAIQAARPVGIEVRRNADGTPDDIVAIGCNVQIEQMDRSHWWIGIEAPTGERVVVNLYTARGAQVLGRAEDE